MRLPGPFDAPCSVGRFDSRCGTVCQGNWAKPGSIFGSRIFLLLCPVCASADSSVQFSTDKNRWDIECQTNPSLVQSQGLVGARVVSGVFSLWSGLSPDREAGETWSPVIRGPLPTFRTSPISVREYAVREYAV